MVALLEGREIPVRSRRAVLRGCGMDRRRRRARGLRSAPREAGTGTGARGRGTRPTGASPCATPSSVAPGPPCARGAPSTRRGRSCSSPAHASTASGTQPTALASAPTHQVSSARPAAEMRLPTKCRSSSKYADATRERRCRRSSVTRGRRQWGAKRQRQHAHDDAFDDQRAIGRRDASFLAQAAVNVLGAAERFGVADADRR